jgi:hypothetical protein
VRLKSALLISAIAGATLVPAAGTAYAADKDCADFSSQSEAQAWYDSHPGDMDRLDRDKDALACEDNSGSSSSETSSSSDMSSPSDMPASSTSTGLPQGGVRTGAGGLAAAGSATGIPIGFALAGALAVGGIVMNRRAQQGR